MTAQPGRAAERSALLEVGAIASEKERGELIREVIHAGKFDQDARDVMMHSLHRFEQRGDDYIWDQFGRERQDAAQISLPLAVAVERGVIGREPALVIIGLFFGKLSPKHIETIAACFPARKAGEDLAAFDQRREAAYQRFLSCEGIGQTEFAAKKQQVRDVLEAYHQVESSALEGQVWPMRDDGQPRRSFIDRARMVKVAIDVAGYADRMSKDHDGTLRELENPKPPQQVEQHSEVLRFVNRAKEGVEAVTYDMFDTLVQWTSTSAERKKLMYAAGTEYIQRQGFAVSETDYQKIRDEVWYKQFKRPAHDAGREFKATDAFRVMIDQFAALKGKTVDPQERERMAEELERVYIGIDADTAVVVPGVKTVLEEFKRQGKKLAVISNHPYRPESVEELLRKFGLRQYFDVVVVSSEVGMEKSPKDENGVIFRETLNRLGVDASRVIHVGDSLENDQIAPAKIGIRGIELHNKNSTQKRMEWAQLKLGSLQYAEAAVAGQREFLSDGAAEYFERSRKDVTPDALKPYAMRLYEMSRDYYGPLVVQFAEHALNRLNEAPEQTLNLCIGRDALAVFLVQRELVRLYPDRYRNIKPEQIQYMNVSRNLALNSSAEDLKAYMEDLGVKTAKRVIVIDNGITGTIQTRFAEIYPDKEFEGEYMYSRKFADDPLKNKKHGFVLEENVTTTERHENGVPKMWRRDNLVSDVDAGLASELFSADAVHGHEDIWNGVFASSEPLARHTTSLGETKVRPKNWRNGVMEKQDFIAGNPDKLPGCDHIENYRLMKRMALKGVMDAMRVYKRQEQLRAQPDKKEAIRSMAEWFAKNNKADTVDRRILDGLVRKR